MNEIWILTFLWIESSTYVFPNFRNFPILSGCFFLDLKSAPVPSFLIKSSKLNALGENA